MATLKLEILTPEAVAYSDDVEMVLLPAELGEMGVYPMHVPLMTRINPGELVVTKGAEKLHLAIGEGFAEITQSRVCVLADMALEEKHIDEKAAEEAVERARTRIKEAAERGANVSDEEVAAVQVMLAKSLAQLKVKRRRHVV
ncbi:MAG: ATP synthase F1 subunit epsilon [Verrucomicrobiota bacterium]